MSEGYMCDGGCDGPTCDGPSHRTPTPREQPMPLTPEQVKEFAQEMQNISTMVYARGLTRRIAQAAAQAERERCAKVAESVVGGYTANVCVDPREQVLLPDPDGPWVLNSDVARAIRAIRVSREQGAK